MKTPPRTLFIALLTIFVSLAFAQAPLSQIFSTGINPLSQVDILVKSIPGETVFSEAPGGITQQNMQVFWNDPAWQTATINESANPYVGFRNENGELRVNPVFWNSTLDPDLSYYTPLETDPVGDHLFNSPWLDITATKVSFSQNRLYFAISNNQGTFPISSGVTFYAYMPVLIDPDALPEDNPIVFGLMFTVDLAGIISPGLYKITGSGISDLVQLGQIQHSIVDQTLLLSCSIQDLLADPDFSAWFDVDYPRIATATTTSKITLVSGTQQADITAGAELLLLPQELSLVNNNAPVLVSAEYDIMAGTPNLLSARISYSDADNNFPLVSSLSIDGGEEHPLLPLLPEYPDFSVGVVFRAQDIPISQNWQQLRFRFSDGVGFVFHTVQNGSDDSDFIQKPQLKLELYPNPALNAIIVKSETNIPAELKVYNLRGQLCAKHCLPKGNSTLQIDTSGYAPGVYFLKSDDVEIPVSRFVKL